MIATQMNTIKNRIDKFIENNVIPEVESWEQTRYVPYHLIKLLGNEGIIRECNIGKDNLSNKLYLANALGKISLGVSCTVLNTLNIPLYILNKHANQFQKSEYLEHYLDGDLIGAIAISEQQGGSDFIENNNTQIEIFKDHILLNGRKHFILNTPGADFVIVLAKSSGEHSFSHTLLIVPTNLDGITINRINTSGLQTASFGEITFDNVRVAKDQVIGKLHRGLVYLDEALTNERLVGTYALMSMAKDILRETYEYVNERPIYEGKLSHLQAVRHKLAELSGEYEVAEAFIHEVAQNWNSQNKKELSLKVAMIKIVCTQAATNVVNGCMQMYGGRGVLHEYKISRQYRDVLGANSFAGTLEMMKEIIANRKL